MISVKQLRRVGLALVALGAIGLSGTAFAQNTASGTTITNTATINYTVNSIAQTPINASTNFVVDTVINLNVTGGTTVNVTPGQTAAVTIFTLTNTSNIASNFTVTPSNQTGDAFDVGNIAVRVDANGNGTYEPATDLGTSVTGLARNASVTVFILGDVAASQTNGQTSIVRLTAQAIDPTTSATWVATGGVGGVDRPNTVDVVLAISTNPVNTAFAQDTYNVVTATLAVTKTSSIISDPFVGTGATRKAIPGSVLEYTITVTNSSTQAATLQSVSDPIPTNTAFFPGQYPGTRDVRVTVGATTTYCIAEVGGTDGNLDGCVLTAGGALSVGAPAVTNVAQGAPVVVSFRVTIN